MNKWAKGAYFGTFCMVCDFIGGISRSAYCKSIAAIEGDKYNDCRRKINSTRNRKY